MNEVSSEKILNLQNIILEHANTQRSAIASDARREAEEWLTKEKDKLEREAALIVADAKSRSEDIHRRQILSAERERATEALRQQNRLLQQTLKKYQDELVRLRERDDYVTILAGVAAGASVSIVDAAPLKLRLAAIDQKYGEKVSSLVNEKLPAAAMVFDKEPAPIIGGCWVETADGRRQINADWQSWTQESSDILADRLLALL